MIKGTIHLTLIKWNLDTLDIIVQHRSKERRQSHDTKYICSLKAVLVS